MPLDSCDTCGALERHEPTDHEWSHTYTPAELLSLGTEVNVFKLNCNNCKAKYEVQTENLVIRPISCAFCGQEDVDGFGGKN